MKALEGRHKQQVVQLQEDLEGAQNEMVRGGELVGEEVDSCRLLT